MFTRYISILFRNEMKVIYWLETTLVRKLTNRMAPFHFGTIQNRKVWTWSYFSIAFNSDINRLLLIIYLIMFRYSFSSDQFFLCFLTNLVQWLFIIVFLLESLDFHYFSRSQSLGFIDIIYGIKPFLIHSIRKKKHILDVILFSNQFYCIVFCFSEKNVILNFFI